MIDDGLHDILDYRDNTLFQEYHVFVCTLFHTKTPVNGYHHHTVLHDGSVHSEYRSTVTLPEKCKHSSIAVLSEVQTQCHTAFLSKQKPDIESECLLPCYSLTKNSYPEPTYYAIFPYETMDSKSLYSEDVLQSRFPKTYRALLQNKDILQNRDKGKLRVPWYAYGRTQGLHHLNGHYIMIPRMLKKDSIITLCEINHKCLFTSGYIVAYSEKTASLYHEENGVKTPSHDFWNTIQRYGKPFSGGYFQIAPFIIKHTLDNS